MHYFLTDLQTAVTYPVSLSERKQSPLTVLITLASCANWVVGTWTVKRPVYSIKDVICKYCKADALTIIFKMNDAVQ